MNVKKYPPEEGLLKRIRKKLFPVPSEVPEELQQAIDCCKSLDALTELLFSTDFIKSESIIHAFDKRMDELEKEA